MNLLAMDYSLQLYRIFHIINCVSLLSDRTGGLSGLHSSSQQSSQQFGYRHSDVVVGSFKGPEAQSGDVLQLAGPQKHRLPLQLQQTLTGRQTVSSSAG